MKTIKLLIFLFSLVLCINTNAQNEPKPVPSPYHQKGIMPDGLFPKRPSLGNYTTYVRTDDKLYLYLNTGSEICLSCISGTQGQQLTLSNNILTLEDRGTVDLSPYLDNTDTQLIKNDIENLGFVDGPHTTNTDTQLNESQVDTFVSNNGYSTGVHTIDTNTQLSDNEVSTAFINENPNTDLDSTDDFDSDAANLTGTLSDARLSPNVTTEGNTFNGNDQLVKTDGSGRLPAIDGSQLTGLPEVTIADNSITPAKLEEGANGQVLSTDVNGDVVWSTPTEGKSVPVTTLLQMDTNRTVYDLTQNDGAAQKGKYYRTANGTIIQEETY